MLVYYRQDHSLMDKNLSNITEYTKEELMNPDIIKSVCNNYYGYDVHITKSGWEFLISYYGYEGLYEIDKGCDFGFCRWTPREYDDSLEEYTKWIHDRMKRYPEVPDNIYPANRPVNIVKAALYVGKTVEEVVELFEMPMEYIRELNNKVQQEKEQKQQRDRLQNAWSDLRCGKSVEEVAQRYDMPLEEVIEIAEEIREQKEKMRKTALMVKALRAGKSAEETAEDIGLPLEFVKEIERKIYPRDC